MTYLDLIRNADRKLDKGDITLGEYEKMIEPLNREIDHVAGSDRKVSISCAHENDLISRKAAIDAVIDEFKRSPTPAIRAKLRPEALSPAQPEPHWIPCEEEMPKEKDAGVLHGIGIENKSDIVLVTIDIENEKIVGTACTWDGMWKWDGMFAFLKWKVIAWMPYPKPYQKGDNYVI